MVLYKKPEVLYAPSDFKDEANFISILDRSQVVSAKDKIKKNIVNKLGSAVLDDEYLDESFSNGISARSMLTDARVNEDPMEKVSLCENILKHPESTSKELEVAGDIMRQLGNYGLALRLYRLAHDKDPERLSAHIEYLSLLAENKPDKRASALKAAKELIVKKPDRSGFARLSNSLIDLDRYEELSEFSTRFIESIGSNHPKLKSLALRNLGVSYKELGRAEDAIEALERAFTIEPEDANVLKPYLGVLEEFGRHEEYLEVARKLIDIDPSDFNYYRIYIAALIKQGLYKDAEEWVKKASMMKKSSFDESILESLTRKIEAANNAINADS